MNIRDHTFGIPACPIARVLSKIGPRIGLSLSQTKLYEILCTCAKTIFIVTKMELTRNS